MDRRLMLLDLVRIISTKEMKHPLRVAIDGVDAAGKTTLADELRTILRGNERTIIRASIDGFHNSAAVRHRDGESPQGYYDNSFNYGALVEELLEPLGPKGTLLYRTAVFDYRTDKAIQMDLIKAAFNSILLFDGVFLLRKELYKYWDFTIFIEVSFDVVLDRVKDRDTVLFGTPEMLCQRYDSRYIPRQKIYLNNEHPSSKAMVIIENDDPRNPKVRYNNSLEQTSWCKLTRKASNAIP